MRSLSPAALALLAACASDTGSHLIDTGVFDGTVIDAGPPQPHPDGGFVMDGGTGCDVDSTFTSLFTVIFSSPTCNLPGCHKAPGQAMLDMSMGQDTTYMNLVNASTNCQSPCMGIKTMFPKRVVPNMPAKSFLLEKLSSASPANGMGGSQMPLSGTPLTQCELDAIKQWIMSGAMNN